jgi:putative lipoprotein (rSAM/lipoprotein system)
MKEDYKQRMNALGGWMTGVMLWTAFSCSSDGNIDAVSDVATANYIINGTVVSEKNPALPIPGLEVVVAHAAPHPSADTLFTGDDGKFGWEGPVSTFGKDLVFTITVTDVDNEKHNQYAPYTTRISFSRDELDNDVSWFLGEAKKEVLIKMQERITPQ